MKKIILFLIVFTVFIHFANAQCQAGFTYSVSNDTVYFTSTSAGYTIPNYYWNFDDGTYSYFANPSHQFSQTGSYFVCLSVIDSVTGCYDTFCDTISISSVPCHAGFSASTNAGLAVYFYDTSWGPPIAWFWDFGDGNTSTMQYLTHIYSAPGNYWVCLMVYTSTDTCTFCDSIVVTACNAYFTFIDSAAQNVVFTDMTNNNPVAWNWDFGDGTSSIFQNPTHQYIIPGNHTVCLTSFTSTGDSCSFCQNICICSSCQAGFTYVLNGNTVTFTDTSNCISGNPTNYYWDFGDGAHSNTQNPSHTYSDGVYHVYLLVWDSTSTCPGYWCDTLGSTTSTTIAINACSAIYTYTNGIPYNISFNDQSFGNISSWYWDFGDGTSSILQNPVHLYPGSGVYFACLEAFITGNSCNWCDSVFVGCVSRFNWYADTSNGDVYFTDHSFANPIGWYWDFGDGSNSSQQSPGHNYTSSGTYYVCLTTYTQFDTCTTCDSVVAYRLAGIDDIILTNKTVQIYPNPANDKIFILYSFPENSLEHIRITDILGQQKYFSDKAVTTINTSFLEQGVYFIEIKEKNKSSRILKFIISR
jgi:PKD repeat protein